MAQVFRCNFLWGASCLSWAQTKRNKRYFTRRRMLHGGGSTARLRRRFHGQDPSTLVTHDTKGVPALLLILSQYHTHPHGMPRAHERRPLCSQFASGNYKMVVAQRGKKHGRPPFTGPSLENGKHMSLWLFRMSSWGPTPPGWRLRNRWQRASCRSTLALPCRCASTGLSHQQTATNEKRDGPLVQQTVTNARNSTMNEAFTQADRKE